MVTPAIAAGAPFAQLPNFARLANRYLSSPWGRDVGAAETPIMSYDQFCKSIFQLVDVWTETCEAQEYVAMLERILKLVGDLRFHYAHIQPSTLLAISGSPHV